MLPVLVASRIHIDLSARFFRRHAHLSSDLICVFFTDIGKAQFFYSSGRTDNICIHSLPYGLTHAKIHRRLHWQSKAGTKYQARFEPTIATLRLNRGRWCEKSRRNPLRYLLLGWTADGIIGDAASCVLYAKRVSSHSVVDTKVVNMRDNN